MAQDTEQLALRFFEERCNGRRAELAHETVAESYVSHGPQAPPAEGLKGVKARVAVYRGAL
jgi:hypothetical protein